MIALAQRPLRLAAAAAALGLVVAGCGESRKASSSTNTAPAQSTTPKSAAPGVAVTEREFSLSPADLEVPKAGTIRISIRNAGGVEHALEVEGPHGESRAGPIAPGGSATLQVVLDKPGRYEWYCPIDGHRAKGMRGTIVVAGGGAAKAKDDKGGKRKHRKSGGTSGSGNSGTGNGSGGSSGGSDGSSGGVAPPSGNSPSDGSYYKG
ncbi:MAG: hypothetical protein QOJ14_2040, partial [Thermoleophilaceae bacterium]|nr:hypothetical protein [Thermoleophilaceae bacterium]